MFGLCIIGLIIAFLILAYVIGNLVRHPETRQLADTILWVCLLASPLIWFAIRGVKLAEEKRKTRQAEARRQQAMTEDEQIKLKIDTLKKQAEDRNIYEKSLKILFSFNKNKVVRNYYYYPDDDLETKREYEEEQKAGIVTYEKNNLIIKKKGSELSIINEDKTVFAWRGVVNANTGRYLGSRVYSYIPGVWEKDIDQLFEKIQQEEKELYELSKEKREREERERFGLE